MGRTVFISAKVDSGNAESSGRRCILTQYVIRRGVSSVLGMSEHWLGEAQMRKERCGEVMSRCAKNNVAACEVVSGFVHEFNVHSHIVGIGPCLRCAGVVPLEKVHRL